MKRNVVAFQHTPTNIALQFPQHAEGRDPPAAAGDFLNPFLETLLRLFGPTTILPRRISMGDGLVWRCGTITCRSYGPWGWFGVALRSINVPVLRTLGMVWCVAMGLTVPRGRGGAAKASHLLNRAGRQSRFAPAAALRFFVALGKALAQATCDAQCRHSPGEDRGSRSRLGCAASPAADVLLRFRRPGWGYLHFNLDVAGSAAQFNQSVSAMPANPSRTFPRRPHQGAADTLSKGYMKSLRFALRSYFPCPVVCVRYASNQLRSAKEERARAVRPAHRDLCLAQSNHAARLSRLDDKRCSAVHLAPGNKWHVCRRVSDTTP